MVDALRYELALQFKDILPPAFKAGITPVCAQLPTVTRVGMAALLPKAETDLFLKIDQNDIIPCFKNDKVVIPDDRLKYLRTFFGDRCEMRDLDDLVTKKNLKLDEKVELLLVKTTDIDSIGEKNPMEALS